MPVGPRSRSGASFSLPARKPLIPAPGMEWSAVSMLLRTTAFSELGYRQLRFWKIFCGYSKQMAWEEEPHLAGLREGSIESFINRDVPGKFARPNQGDVAYLINDIDRGFWTRRRRLTY